jgi:hypothetical protein
MLAALGTESLQARLGVADELNLLIVLAAPH